MDYKNWKRLMKTGGYRRKIVKKYNEMLKTQTNIPLPGQGSVEKNISEGSAGFAFIQEVDNNDGNFVINDFSEDESPSEDETNYEKTFVLKNDVKKWALKFNISHAALIALLFILNDVLPKDARTLIETNKEIVHISNSAPGMYWHSGLITRLIDILGRLSCTPDIIHLNINIDGLPVSNSSRRAAAVAPTTRAARADFVSCFSLCRFKVLSKIARNPNLFQYGVIFSISNAKIRVNNLILV